MSVGRSSVSRGNTGLAKACSRTDGPVAATKRASWLCGRAFNPSRTAIATDAEAADSIHQSRPEIARAAGEPSMSRITLDILLLGIADDRAFDRRVRPDVQVRRGETAQPTAAGEERFGRPHIVPQLAEHRRRGHRPTEGTPWRVVAHPD